MARPLVFAVLAVCLACGQQGARVETRGSPPSVTLEVQTELDQWEQLMTAQDAISAFLASVPAAKVARPAPRSTAPDRGPDGCGGWRHHVADLWPAGQVDRACNVLWCESKGDPGAENRSGASGLMQLLGKQAMFAARGWPYEDRFDGVRNLTVAHDLWKRDGWSPWVCKG